jgi:hypothetical protein
MLTDDGDGDGGQQQAGVRPSPLTEDAQQPRDAPATGGASDPKSNANEGLRESTDAGEEEEEFEEADMEGAAGGGLEAVGSFDDRGEDVLEFDVQRKSLPNFMGESIANPYGLLINQTLGRLTIVKKAKWNRRYDVKLIDKLELAVENARLLHIEWKKDLVVQELSPQSRVPIHKRHSYIFGSPHGTCLQI